MAQYTLKSIPTASLPVPENNLQAVPTYPENLSETSVHVLVRLYTQYTTLLSGSTYQLGILEANHASKKNEYEKAVTLRFVHDSSKSTTERKERAKASKAVCAIAEEMSILQQDIFVVRSLIEGYKAYIFSIKTEIERRRNE